MFLKYSLLKAMPIAVASAVLAIGLIITPTTMANENVSPAEIPGATTIDTATAKDMFAAETLFVDVRKDSDWNAGRIPGAEHLELKTVLTEESLGALASKDENIVIYCNGPSCMRSGKASTKVVAWGYTNVFYYREGFPAWKAAGNAIE